MECPECEEELNYHDYYYIGNLSAYEKGYENSGFQKIGDIYKCENEECNCFGDYFYTKGEDGELYEGYPC